jgi:phosphopantothenoylcysteine decarboxylase/phosphopantothenate--cysteine ligase
MLDLARKRIVLGMTGGVACYKIAELVRRISEQGAAVDVVMTDAATHFITPVTMQALSGRPVFVSQWDTRIDNNMPHIDLTRGADAVLIAPASADFMAKLAHGMADDLLSTLCLARNCPLLVVPAMNREMWANRATQRNAAQLREDGIEILGPAAGDQACGETGDGRMLEPHEILADIIAFFQPKPLAGKHVLLTAGPTVEPIDPIRVISNRSSGKTGYAIARAAREAGARVTMVTGPTALPVPRGVDAFPVQTARQMHDAVMAQARQADVFIAVAAVADWHVKNASAQKLKKDAGGGGAPALEFAPNPDILADVAALEDGPWCVGFAAETEDLSRHAQAKRVRKGIPLLVGNLAHKVMDLDTTELVLFDENGVHALPAAAKLDAARRLIAEIAARLPVRAR